MHHGPLMRTSHSSLGRFRLELLGVSLPGYLHFFHGQIRFR
jgi:hypothetical protein